MTGLAQLEELVLRCRNEQSRRYIAEAVACYNGGAYRACIVTTWIAVVLDILAKLRELEMTGDAKARVALESFSTHHANGNVEKVLQFERGILDMARDEFELLSKLEHEDLKRLQDDRNRCAHPSMSSGDESYTPSAELARSHIRNAVEYVLQRPPVQGKAALERLIREVRSDYFPATADEAVRSFGVGPLSRPRETLVRSFLLCLAKGVLLEEMPPNDRKRWAVGINALRQMYPEICVTTFKGRLPDLVRAVADVDLQRALWFLYQVRDTWQYLTDDCRAKLCRYVSELPESELWPSIAFALDVGPLSRCANTRLQQVDASSLASVATMDPLDHKDAYLARALELWKGSRSFRTTARLTDVILLAVDRLNNDDIERLLEEGQVNSQIRNSGNLPRLIEGLRENGGISREELGAVLRKHRLEWTLEE